MRWRSIGGTATTRLRTTPGNGRRIFGSGSRQWKGKQHEPWTASEVECCRSSRSAPLSRGRCIDRASRRDVARVHDHGASNPSRAAREVRARKVARTSQAICPVAFVHVRKFEAKLDQHLEFPHISLISKNFLPCYTLCEVGGVVYSRSWATCQANFMVSPSMR